MQHRTGNLDLDHPASAIDPTDTGAAADSSTRGTKVGPSARGRTSFPRRDSPRHCERCRAINPSFAATSQTRAPGSRLSATLRAFRSSDQRRRPVGPSRTSIRDTHLRPGTSIRCSFWCSTAILPQNSFAGCNDRKTAIPKPRGGRTAYLESKKWRQIIARLLPAPFGFQEPEICTMVTGV